LKYYLDYVDTLVTVAASKTQIPNDLKTQVSDYLTAVIDLQTAQQSRYDALKAKNKINYLAANDDVSTKGKIFATSAMPIESYYQTLATRIKVSAKELQTYAETIQ
jgi:uncharacterized protein YdeI (YjbR/CyaY-like superfamily)